VKVAQLDAAADPVRPVHFRPLSLEATGMSQNWTSKLQPGKPVFQLQSASLNPDRETRRS
jgi:hypothetical protein